MDRRPSENIDGFLKLIREAQEEYNIAQDRIKDADMESQDILHWTEFHGREPGNEKYAEKMQDVLGEVREGRRKAKNTAEILEPVVKWAEQHKSTINGLEQLLGDMRKTEKAVKNRAYMDRTDVMKRILGALDRNGTDTGD